MRFDSIGMFWQDLPTSRKRSELQRPQPPIPETGWRAPTDFPNLSGAAVLSIDTETYDPELLVSGPGWARHKGCIVGFSVGAKDRAGNIGQWYFPIRHMVNAHENLDPDQCLAWLRHTMSDASQPKVGANLIYDYGWCAEEGVTIAGELHDIQYAEALLQERGLVALGFLASKYLAADKETSLLYQWCADYYGGGVNETQRKNIWRSPPSLVGPYGEADASLPLRIIDHQWPLLAKEGLLDLYRMECDMIPLMVAMRYAGVTIDVPYAEQLYETFGKEVDVLNDRLGQELGFHINVNSGDDLARAFDSVGLPYARTAASNAFPDGRPSFTADFLETVEHPVGKLVTDIRQREKLRGTFIKSYLLDNQVNGVVYGSFNQLRGDGKGTRSGRFSSDTPNLQNIPIRSEIGKTIRRAFVHDPGHVTWRKYDYSQIEYRMLAHFAIDKGDGSAERLRQSYVNDPNIDYHKYTHDLIFDVTGVDLIRGHTKNMNFGLIYGMGEPLLIRKLGVTASQGKALFNAYHTGAPYAKATMEAAIAEAQTYGVITTILGRRSRFDMWEPASYAQKGPGLPYNLAQGRYGAIKRAYTHKALNRRLQGSAADQMKKAMHQCWTEGVFAETGVPRLTVHDELDFSDPGGRDKAFDYMQHVLETCVPLKVPVRADYEKGPNWGDVT